jgi:hypothetical protein
MVVTVLMSAPLNRDHFIGNHIRGAIRAGGGAVHSINCGSIGTN